MKLGAAAVVAAGLATLTWAAALDVAEDVQLRAMRDELQRAQTLTLNNLDKPYFIQYTSSDNTQYAVSASLGGLVNGSFLHVRQPKLQVRVGSYQLDNTNAVFSREVQSGLLPVDDNYLAMRDYFWLWTDLFYKAGIDQINAKRTAINEVSSPQTTPDFAPAKAVQVLQAPASFQLDEGSWRDEVRRLSRLLAAYANVMNSQVRMRSISSTYRLVNTEGTTVRIPQELTDVDIVASTFAADGARVWNHRLIAVLRPEQLPSEAALSTVVKSIGSETEALARAPLGEEYSGPVLFAGEAAAQAMAEVLTDSVRIQRKPLIPPGGNPATGTVLENIWASKLNARVLPEWMTLVDDPHQKTFDNVSLAGEYDVDDEGVPSERVLLVDRGVLKTFLMSRTPVGTYHASNGHGRLPGGYGNTAAAFGNLFVQTTGGISEDKLRARLIRQVKQAKLPYGMIIRRIDYPSTANLEEWRSMLVQMQKSGSLRTLNAPLLAYRLYPDGREELVRGLRFREFSVKDLREISAASDRPYVFNYVNNGSAQNVADMGSEATTSSVICPSLLFDAVDLAQAEGNSGRLPLVPSPAIAFNISGATH